MRLRGLSPESLTARSLHDDKGKSPHKLTPAELDAKFAVWAREG